MRSFPSSPFLLSPARQARPRARRAGFTLIEIIVSLALFSVVAVIAVGALVRVVGANRQAQSIQTSVNGLSFALESMTRELRTGTTYSCQIATGWTWLGSGTLSSNPCTVMSGGSYVLAFSSSNVSTTGSGAPCNLIYAYRFLQNTDGTFSVEKAEQTSCGQAINAGGGSAPFVSIVPSGVTITGYRLGVYQSGQTYPWAFVRLTGYSVGQATQASRTQDQNYFDIETSASERTTG